MCMTLDILFQTDVEFVPDDCVHGAIRLVGGLNAHEGRVEVCINDVWGTVCDVNWNTNDANVACQQAGFLGSGRSVMCFLSWLLILYT